MTTPAPRRQPPPPHVVAAFGAKGADPEPMPAGFGWRCGDLVLKPVHDRARALWQARTMERIALPDVRVARPVRSTDGRSIVGGWAACRFVSGTPQPRYDELVLAAVKLHQATAHEPRPDFLDSRRDVYAIADRMAWEELEPDLDERKGGGWFEVLAGARRPVHGQNQLVHGELFGRVLFDGDEPPGIVDFEPYFRPAEWGAAVATVDALAWGGADSQLLQRWAHLPEWPQLVLRATLFRLAIIALDPHFSPSSLDGLRLAAREVSALL
ncbi:TIGR02569 family protein [Amycolatopsis magusensis]|uniref:Uncharacterized protein (TIGR02569 family) n=1 Tax=Amycolatopsis magusensis TaxID=882444 RepID=A0ABS4PPM3_9PSEU|nr:TIGR02569 family protein [Amycolatopsis magusensis]MBP2180845.1 uncharacterized protein (TIGR02569 family) [Amycolatopsis magusensis]